MKGFFPTDMTTFHPRSIIAIPLLTILMIAQLALSQSPSTGAPLPPPATNQASPPDPNLPSLTHDQKVKLFDFEDQQASINAEFQKKINDVIDPIRKDYESKVNPIKSREDEYIKLINEEHPGYELQHTGQGLQFVKKDAEKKSANTSMDPKQAPKK